MKASKPYFLNLTLSSGKCAARSSTLELYTGPVFSAHLAIAAHLRHVPDVLSGEHGIVAWTQDIEPYETTLNTAEQRGRFNALAATAAAAATTTYSLPEAV